MINNATAPIPGIADVPELSKDTAPIPGIADVEAQPFDYKKSLGYSFKPVTFADVQKKTKLDQMANGGAYTTVKAIGTGLAATANPVGMGLAALAYLGSEGYLFLKSSSLAQDEDAFWQSYFDDVNEVIAEKGTFGDFVAGFSTGSSIFTGHTLPSEVKEVTEGGAFVAGNITGMLTRDFTMMSIGAGTAKGIGAAAEVGSNMGFIAGASISNALNTATDSYALDGGVINAMRNGFAHGAATGITGHFFLNHFGSAMKKVMPKLLDTTIGASIKSGTEFSAWGLGEEVLNSTINQGLGGDRDFNIDPVTYAAMFGLGAVGAAVFRSKKGANIIDDIVDEFASSGAKIAKEFPVKDIATGSLAKQLTELPSKTLAKDAKREVRKQTIENIKAIRKIKEDLMKDIESFINPASLKTSREIRSLADLILLEGKRTGETYQQILLKKMTNDSRYVNMSGDDIDNISKMVFERFTR